MNKRRSRINIYSSFEQSSQISNCCYLSEYAPVESSCLRMASLASHCLGGSSHKRSTPWNIKLIIFLVFKIFIFFLISNFLDLFSFYPIIWKDHLTRGQHPGTPTSLTRAPFCHPGSYFKLSFKIRRSSPPRPRNSLTWQPRGRVPIKHALTTGPFLP